ncbi:uncharacterized protein YycO [Virgibacillus natechei]|uniref:Uncharacterized protein YycO n=1 Tax=Virgibacillus natechei TaxID=1216297 RepID=A0ABS4IH56_9BACI|nr:hypothetical protein [Virgibacillus natechei]MBP1970279.1 uncharacterized protein YycO [Virgibacillus natechei]UZD13107.1 hypothetical protein OLD84_00580 [Virgibacillus natechei]
MNYVDEADDPVHIYPRTSILMQPGDIIYSHKTGLSSFIVGHEGIVGEDFKIYHVNSRGRYGHSDSMPIYLSRHKKGEKLTILRNKDAEIARQAAKWAKRNIENVTRYTYSRNLADVERNYCSKFVWQAYFYGSEGEIDLTDRGSEVNVKRYITPTHIYRNLVVIGHFTNNLYHR